MKSLDEYILEQFINEAKDEAVKPFTSKEELMAFIDEVEKTKLIVKKYEDEADKYWKEMTKAQNAADREFKKVGGDKLKGEEWSKKYHELEEKYKVDEYMKMASDVTKAPECVEANKKLYGELQQRALDSLTPKEQKNIGKRGGRMYNILADVLKKYTHWDYKKNCPA